MKYVCTFVNNNTGAREQQSLSTLCILLFIQKKLKQAEMTTKIACLPISEGALYGVQGCTTPPNFEE